LSKRICFAVGESRPPFLPVGSIELVAPPVMH
jgi:hypothetical protein